MNNKEIINQVQRARIKRTQRKRDFRENLLLHGEDILSSQKFKSTKNHVQHGTVSVYRHCLDVANQSLKIARALRIKVNQREMIRGALLHDYFLYDWHTKDHECSDKLHGFEHPKIALRNAKKDYTLTTIEQDIIRKHMWPLTPIPPRYREAWIVSMADKYCSTLETLRIRKGNLKRKKI